MKKIISLFIGIFMVSCSSSDIDTKDIEYVRDPMNPNRLISKKEADRIGKLDLFGTKKVPKKDDFRINKYLWDACLDVLSDLPPLHIKPEIGLYQTGNVKTNNGTVSIQCRISGEKISSDNIDVTVFDNTNNNLSSFKDSRIKGQILLRARELKIDDVRAL